MQKFVARPIVAGTIVDSLQAFVLAGALALSSLPALADSGLPLHLRGEVRAVSGQTIEVAPIGGAEVTVGWNAQTRISALKPARLTDIKPGMFVGTAALPQSDGTLRALEVHIFPESMRGTGEGYRPFPEVPQGTMTNATISNIVGKQGSFADDGLTLTLNYKDGWKTVTVPPGTPVVLIAPGDPSMIQPHVKISVTAARNGSGNLVASRIQVGLDGVTPPL